MNLLRAHARLTRLATPTLLGIALIGAALLATGNPAQAHGSDDSTVPSAGQTLTTLPEFFSVTADDPLLTLDQNSGFGLQVQDSAGTYYGDGCVTVEGKVMRTAAALGAAGSYRVTWQVISNDGHQSSNTFAFTWQPPAGSTASVGSPSAPNCHAAEILSTPAAGATPAATDSAAGNGPLVITGAPASRKSTVSGSVLGTVLWVGGGLLATAVTIIAIVLLVSRRRNAPPAN